MIAFSVIIPLYNGAAFIEHCIDSILAQTFPPLEILVVDDGSTDHGAALVREKAYPLVRLISQANAGVSAARNRGMNEARAPFVTFLDADDDWEPDHLATLTRLIEKYPQCGVFGTSYYYCKPGQKRTLPLVPNRFTFTGEEGVLDNYFELASGIHPPLHMSSFCVRTDLLRQLGGFPVGIPAGEDVLTLARLHASCDMAYCRRASSTYYLYPMEGKKPRPVQWHNPIDQLFNELLHTAHHRPGVRRFVASWHKGRMVGAILAGWYRLALREFLIAFRIFPFQRKLFSALAAAIYARATHQSLYEVNSAMSDDVKSVSKKKRRKA